MKPLQKALSRWEKVKNQSDLNHASARDVLDEIVKMCKNKELDQLSRQIWHQIIYKTGKTTFLQSLNDASLQYRWAEMTFQLIRHSQYHLRILFEQQTREHPRKILFRDYKGTTCSQWTYEQIYRNIREIATLFFIHAEKSTPRVAIWAENSVDSACCDLACLCYDILNTPVSIHFDESTVMDIFEELKINIVVTDSHDKAKILNRLQKKTGIPLTIFLLDPLIQSDDSHFIFLGTAQKQLHVSEVEKTLKNRTVKPLNEIATVMYTSGTTGQVKGVCFSMYNLITKRFARAAALPKVGQNEVMICYLPLFHTFGRFLELLGTIYWGGTYVFPGNPSIETLLQLFPQVNPTGFISIPLRWEQLKETCLEKLVNIPDPEIQEVAFRNITGNRLRWGLSAAGHLDSSTFQFFQKHGVDLCSGFGMTEATGGITMTPPLHYVKNTHGIALPGIHLELNANKELLISGHYVARYFEEIGLNGTIPYPKSPRSDFWLATGDVFKITKEGYYQIVDRIKDIYKNNKGQTIAPKKVENKFINVPGIQYTFLVGDEKPYNVLFIIPDLNDPVMKSLRTTNQYHEYFHQIVTAANKDLAPYERVINYAVLDREFSLDEKELTPKGSFNRKVIIDHFAETISELYRSDFVEKPVGTYRVRIPRWFYRDLIILEDDIVCTGKTLKNNQSGEKLVIQKNTKTGFVRIGHLEYRIQGEIIDLGLFARQPLLWMGNPALVAFCPIKEGWDVPLNQVSSHVFLPWKHRMQIRNAEESQAHRIRNHRLARLHEQFSMIQFSKIPENGELVDKIGKTLKKAPPYLAEVIRRRLESLARHSDESIRCHAYKILLLNESEPDFGQTFPAFINSGLTFLNQETIEAIAFTKLEQRRLEVLRQRLFIYRLQLDWPVNKATRQQFEHVFQLLVSFVGYHPEFYNTVRAELASWVLHRSDPVLAKIAEKYFTRLFKNFESQLEQDTPKTSKAQWENKLVFEDGMSQMEIQRINKVLIGTTFLKQSIMLAFDQKDFNISDVSGQGIWISRIQSSHEYLLYRMSINTFDSKHFDLQLVLREQLPSDTVAEAVHWLEAVAGYPFGPPVLPRLGCYRPELGARSMVFMNEISVWGKIRQFSSIHFTGGPFPKQEGWRKLFVEAMAAFYRGWRNSGNRIVPGAVFPHNAVVPELDFREGATILSLIGWQDYTDPLTLVRPMLQNFYRKTVAHYPWCKDQIEIEWIFDACIEALGMQSAQEFFQQLKSRLKSEPLLEFGDLPLLDTLNDYLIKLKRYYYKPLALRNAVERYRNWEKMNQLAPSSAREQTVVEFHQLYRLDRYPEIARYFYYRDTYFSHANPDIRMAFDRLLSIMSRHMDQPAIQLVELSDLQSVIDAKTDRDVFSRMVFPRHHHRRRMDVLKIGESEIEHVIVHSTFTDKVGSTYTMRSPITPAEIGQLYRLFFNEKYPKTISEQDQHFVVIDAHERIVGGICYQIPEDKIAQIEGTVVSSPLKDRGIHTAMIEDFCNRMASNKIQLIKAPLIMQPFYVKNGFSVDKRWGTLVKFLTPEQNVEI
ncbi:GNAT family N-acetyltransferase [bacterium]|nr:GNAT family N-acetyltransferase [bacterium]